MPTHQPQISVIVPVYKAEKYLRRCVDSILAQTFKDFELLLIDDGSPDNSGLICDEYAKADSRVRVIHKENGGVSSARQTGLDNAKGEYIIHADPDDWVEPDMLQELYEKAHESNADMVICDFYENSRNEQRYIKQQPSRKDRSTVLHELLQQLHGSCWNKLVRRACFMKNDISFPQIMNCWEDRFVNVRLLLIPNFKVEYVPKAYYHYDMFENQNSLVRKPTKRTVLSQMYFIDYLSPILGNDFFDELESLKILTKYIAWYYALMDEGEYRQLYPEISKESAKKQFPSCNITNRFFTISFNHYHFAKFLYCLLKALQCLRNNLKHIYVK